MRCTDTQFVPRCKDQVYLIISDAYNFPREWELTLSPWEGISKAQKLKRALSQWLPWAEVVHIHSVSSLMALYMLSGEWQGIWKHPESQESFSLLLLNMEICLTCKLFSQSLNKHGAG